MTYLRGWLTTLSLIGRTIVLDALDLLQGLIDGGFVGQQGVGDIEVAFLFGTNGRHAIQRALIAIRHRIRQRSRC